MWQKNGSGPLYKSMWIQDGSGGRLFVLIATTKNRKGESYKNVEANSWQMLKRAGWSKVE